MLVLNWKAIVPAGTLVLAAGMSYATADPASASGGSPWSGWPLAILTAIGTAALTTGGTFFVTYYGHRWTVVRDTAEERERRATYVAARVVCMLDPFAVRCVDVVNDEGTYVDGDLEPAVLPPTLEYPDLDWKTMDAELMYRTLALPNEILSAESIIAGLAEYSSAPEYVEVWAERRFQYGRVGLYALDLAEALRKRYGLPPKESSRWDPRGALDAAYTVEDVRRKKADEGIKKMIQNYERKKASKEAKG
jgi:hypothetical protein